MLLGATLALVAWRMLTDDEGEPAEVRPVAVKNLVVKPVAKPVVASSGLKPRRSRLPARLLPPSQMR